MPRILIDDNLRYQDGCQGRTWIEYQESPEIVNSSQDAILLELQLGEIKGIPCYRLVEEKTQPDGTIEVIQEFLFAPDIAYSLFEHWQQLDKESSK